MDEVYRKTSSGIGCHDNRRESSFGGNGLFCGDDTNAAAGVDGPGPGEEEGKEEEEGTKTKWSKQLEFTFSCIGYCVGLGAVWRLPYLCLRNGGGAFLVAYFACLILCGMPLFYLELCIGQFSGLAPLSIWNVCPLFKGIGWAMVIMSAVATLYYNLVLTWVLYYLGSSFTAQLPWASCDNWWNTDLCYTSNERTSPTTTAADNSTNSSDTFVVAAVNSTGAKLVTAAEEFWQNNVLELSPGIHEPGHVRWQLLLCLFGAWFLIFLCLGRGIRTSGKVAYVTATAPYVFLTIFLVRGLMLPGAIDGIKYYLIPDFNQLKNMKVWAEACLQIFYSLGPAWGGLIAMASYNKFDNDCKKDTIIVSLSCCVSSFFGGLVCIAIVGHMAHTGGLSITSVITSGPGLSFISFPEAIASLPFSPIWAIIFFLMLLALVIDTQFGMLETCTSGLIDEFPKFLGNHRTLLTAVFCAAQFLIGIPFVTQAGMYLFQIMDWYSTQFSAMLIGFLECIVLAYIYGADRLYKDMELMSGKPPSMWWKICWRYITPIIMLILLVYSSVNMAPPTYGDYQYPGWAIGIGWTMGMLSIIQIPAVAIYKIATANGSLIQRIKHLLKPTEVWGPSDSSLRSTYGVDPVEKDRQSATVGTEDVFDQTEMRSIL